MNRKEITNFLGKLLIQEKFNGHAAERESLIPVWQQDSCTGATERRQE